MSEQTGEARLFEVIYYGGAGDADGADGRDAIYLVVAQGLDEALVLVAANLYHWDREGPQPVADVVQELGSSALKTTVPEILRGPYFAFGYEFGGRCWHRDADSGEWKEQTH